MQVQQEGLRRDAVPEGPSSPSPRERRTPSASSSWKRKGSVNIGYRLAREAGGEVFSLRFEKHEVDQAAKDKKHKKFSDKFQVLPALLATPFALLLWLSSIHAQRVVMCVYLSAAACTEEERGRVAVRAGGDVGGMPWEQLELFFQTLEGYQGVGPALDFARNSATPRVLYAEKEQYQR